MIIFSIVLIILKLTLIYNFEINTPFYLNSNEEFYQIKHTESSELKIITLNETETLKFSLKISNKDIKTFNIVTKHSKYKTLIFAQQLNPFISDLPNEIKIKLLCKFYYPISEAGDNAEYNCSFYYLSKQSQQIFLGNCQLSLRMTSSFCTILAYFKEELISKSGSILVLVKVSKSSKKPNSNDVERQNLTSSNLTIELKNIDYLIWYKSFYNETSKIGLLLGIPKGTVNKDSIFALPIKLLLPQVFTLPLTLNFYFNLSKDVIFAGEHIIANAEVLELNEDSPKNVLSLSLTINSNNFHNVLVSFPIFVLKFNLKAVSKLFHISAIVQEFSTTSNLEAMLQKKIISISVEEEEKLIMIPVYDRPIIFKNVNSQIESYTLKIEEFKVYYMYDDKNAIDCTHKLLCQSFNKSKLKCPSSLKSYVDEQSDYINNYKSIEWSIEVKLDNWKMILEIKPRIINDNVWDITISDHVLNRINGWRSAGKISRNNILFGEDCSLSYQITPLKIFRKVNVYGEINQNPVEMILDVTSKVALDHLKITPPIAEVYKYGNNLFLQGLREGDFKLDVTDGKDNVLISKDLKIFNHGVSVQDIDVSCHPSIDVTSESFPFSFLVNIHKIKIHFKNFNKSENCLLSIDLIFNDSSRYNIFTIPQNSFILKFITNRKVIKVFDLNNMFYNYTLFNNETSFYIEIMESYICSKPVTVFKKLIHLEPPTKPKTLSIASTKKYIITTPSTLVSTIYTMIVTTKSQLNSLNLLLILTCVIVLVIMFAIFVVIIFWKFCDSKRKLRNPFCKRRQLSGKDTESNIENSPFSNNYPPLLPSPGPQVGVIDNLSVTLSSPQSFWCLNNGIKNRLTKKQPFSRHLSIPFKDCSRKGNHKYTQPPLRWIQKILPEEIDMNVYNSQDTLDISPISIPYSGSQMCWSVTHMEGDQSSGIGSLMTNIDDFLKDPYEARDKFSRLSEIPRMLTDNKETVYEPI